MAAFSLTPNTPERIRAFTLLGITELMRTHRQAARDAFVQALRLDPSLRIDSLADLHSDALVVFAESRAAATGAPPGGSGSEPRPRPAEGSLSEPNLVPRANNVALATDRITAGTVRNRVLVMGNQLGETTRTTTRVQEGGRDAWRVITQTNISSGGQTSDTSVFDAATLAPIRVRRGGREQNQYTFVRLDYAAGRVRGQARVWGQGRPSELIVDTTVVAGTLDDSQLGSLLEVLPYTAGARWTVPVFSGSRGVAQPMTVAVMGNATTATPAGTFETWQLEITSGEGTEATLVAYVAKTRPIIVRLEVQGAPVVFELVSRN